MKPTDRYHSLQSEKTYLRRRTAQCCRITTATRPTASEQRRVNDGREEQEALLPQLCGKVCSSCCSVPVGPIRRWQALITLVDGNRTGGFYLYHSFQTNVGGRWSATETTQKVIQIDFRQKIIKYFYFEQKAINIQTDLAFDSINNTDNCRSELSQSCNR